MNPQQILSEQAEAGSHQSDFTGSSQDRHGPGARSSKRHPCPICGRTKDGDCEVRHDGLVFCHRGSSSHPPEWAIKPGDYGQCHDGQTWAFLGDSDLGRAQFRIHKPRSSNGNGHSSDEPLRLAPIKIPRPAAIRHWTYTDRDGQPLIRVRRSDDGSGGRKIWQESLVPGKAPRDLLPIVAPYRHQEALEALEGGAPMVFWVEGEPCADALWELGLPAVSCIGGAGQFRPERDAGLFPPDRLAVVPDRDAAGLAHARAIDAAHPGSRWLLCWPDQRELWGDALPEAHGLDVADWIASGATVEDLLAAVATTPPGPAGGEQQQDDDRDTRRRSLDQQYDDLVDARIKGETTLSDVITSEITCRHIPRDRIEDEVIQRWARRRGYQLPNAVGTVPKRGRMIGTGDPDTGPGIAALLPGFINDHELHVFAADAGAGKTHQTLAMIRAIQERRYGFLDQETPRHINTTDTRSTVLYIATDGEGGSFGMIADYCERVGIGAAHNLEVWAQDDDTGEAAWTVSLPNLERLAQRLADGDVALVVIDTAKAAIEGAGISIGIGPVGTYLRTLKAIVCRHCALWINHHTNRTGRGIKSIASHPAFMEVPGGVHTLELIDRNGEGNAWRWTVQKLRGSERRSFLFDIGPEGPRVIEGHFYENCREQVLAVIAARWRGQRDTPSLPTTPAALAEHTGRPIKSIYNALDQLRQQRLIRARGRGYRPTPQGERTAKPDTHTPPKNTNTGRKPGKEHALQGISGIIPRELPGTNTPEPLQERERERFFPVNGSCIGGVGVSAVLADLPKPFISDDDDPSWGPRPEVQP
jgi:hypothetical protein